MRPNKIETALQCFRMSCVSVHRERLFGKIFRLGDVFRSYCIPRLDYSHSFGRMRSLMSPWYNGANGWSSSRWHSSRSCLRGQLSNAEKTHIVSDMSMKMMLDHLLFKVRYWHVQKYLARPVRCTCTLEYSFSMVIIQLNFFLICGMFFTSIGQACKRYLLEVESLKD